MSEGSATDELHLLGLSPKTVSALRDAGIFTCEHLGRMPRRELQRLHGIDAKDVARLSMYLR